MDRRDGERDYYGPYEGYNRDDEHYHSAINLTNQFERDYKHNRGRWNSDEEHMRHSYHQGDLGDNVIHMKNERRDYGYNQGAAWSRYNSDFGSFSREDENYRGYGNGVRNQNDYDYNSDYGYHTRPNYDKRDAYSSYSRGDAQDIYPGSGGDDRRSRYSGWNNGSRSGSNAGDLWSDSDRRRYQVYRYY